MATKKTIAVVGATGAQGGGLARAILNDPDGPFQVRALTRNTRSDKATDLARLGAEVVEADLDDLESLKRAFQSAYGAYCVTNYWEHLSPEREMAQSALRRDRCLDTHPPVREYFGEQLRSQQTGAWQECNRRLYHYFRTLAPQLPNSF